jgi:outer membrane biosynthesis protein TonB
MAVIRKNLNDRLEDFEVFLKSLGRKLSGIWEYINRTSNIELYNIKNGVLDLKRDYRTFFLYGILFSASLHVIFVAVFFINERLKGGQETLSKENFRQITVVNVPPPPITQDEEKFVAPPPELPVENTQIALPKKDLKALEPKPVRRAKAEEQTVKSQRELEEIKTPVSREGDTTDFVYSGELGYVNEEKITEKVEEKIKKKEPVEENKIYQTFQVEKAPNAVNLAQIKNSMKYPSFAVEAGIEGRVTVKVLVDKRGNVLKTGNITGPAVFF